jgi:hypothetical protein
VEGAEKKDQRRESDLKRPTGEEKLRDRQNVGSPTARRAASDGGESDERRRERTTTREAERESDDERGGERERQRERRRE